MPPPNPFRAYLKELRANLAAGNATEHTHRPALKTLLEAAVPRVTATNEPRRIACGAPDFVVSRTARESAGVPQPVGYVEAKDCGVGLDAIERDSKRRNPRTDNGKQLKRYRAALSNLLLTNYLEFRWYLDGEPRQVVRLADLDDGDGLTVILGGTEALRGLLQYFLIQGPAEVSSAEDLAQRMARIAHMIRNIVAEGFKRNHVSHGVRDLYVASQQALVPDMAEDAFADMFAQTLAYGLFAARVNHQSGSFRWQDAAHDIPAANPFVRQVFDLVTGPDLNEEPFVSFVDDLAQLLNAAQMDLVLADFGKHGVRKDPIMHFYETFLAAYDPELRERFGCPEGLADHGTARYVDHAGEEREAHRVLVLDPACGTGSFLYAVVDHVREYHQTSGRAGMWRGYVKDHLLPRLFGFELLMAAYAMAHLKLGMQLAALDLPEAARADWAYPFDPGERLRVYLTNTLEPGEDQAPTMFGPLRALTAEARAAADVKRDLPIMVVLGNPPYSGSSANHSRRNGELTWIGELIEDYKKVDGAHFGERSRNWMQDDYVKFIRFGQWRIHQSGAGILAFITNHAYLKNPTFRGMRQQLMDTFTDIYVLDLHGNARLGERAPDGGVDENVFDIQQGVAIGIFVKQAGKCGPATVHHTDLWGERQDKYTALGESDVTKTAWEVLEPESPNYLFKPWDTELGRVYSQWPSIPELMKVNSTGIVTSRDRLTIGWSREDMLDVIRDFAALPPEAARSKYRLPNDAGSWRVPWAQYDLTRTGVSSRLVRPIMYRLFDTRYTYYTGKSQGFLWRPRADVMQHMLAGNNIGMITCRQQAQAQSTWSHCGVTDSLIESCAISNKTREINYLFPLYLFPSGQEIEQGLYRSGERRPNLDSRYTAELAELLGLKFVNDGRSDLDSSFGPEDVFHYIYAVLHSPSYRERYAQFLRADFPRVPPPNDLSQFRTLTTLGRKLTDVHLLKPSAMDDSDITFPIVGEDVVEPRHPRFVAPGTWVLTEAKPTERGRVYINGKGARAQYFEGIEPDVWEFRIGGYQPLKKWLQDRKGRTLSNNDLRHYIRIAAALRETIRLMAAIDQAGLPFP